MAGLACLYITGTLWFSLVHLNSLDLKTFIFSFATCVIPFIIPDIIKIAVALIISEALKKQKQLIDFVSSFPI